MCANSCNQKASHLRFFEVAIAGITLSSWGKKCFSLFFLFNERYQHAIILQCFENDCVFSVSAHAEGFNFTSSHSADKCQEDRVKPSPRHGRYCPQHEQICAVGRTIT